MYVANFEVLIHYLYFWIPRIKIFISISISQWSQTSMMPIYLMYSSVSMVWYWRLLVETPTALRVER